MFKINSQNIVTAFHHGKLIVQKNSPAILMGVGIVGVVASTVLACKATLKADQVIAESDYEINKVHLAHETLDSEKYSEEDFKRDLTIVHVKKVVNIAKLYGPAALVGVASIGCLIGSHHILNKRNVGLMAAYALVDESFKTYRKRVVEELGEKKDLAFRHGLKEETITETETSEDGSKKKVKKTVLTTAIDGYPSGYARYFDESSTQWRSDPTHNIFFLKGQQNYFNDLLKIHGHVFLNEVYDALGFPRTSAGAIVGWVYEGDGVGDNYIDFGIFAPENVDAVNGYAKQFILDFNVDGVIYDCI